MATPMASPNTIKVTLLRRRRTLVQAISTSRIVPSLEVVSAGDDV